MHNNTLQETPALQEAYKAVSNFFDVFNLPEAKQYITSTLLAASSRQIWKGKCPADAVFFYQELKRCTAALIKIAGAGCVREEAIIITNKDEQPDYANAVLYCRKYEKHEHWLYIPQQLSTREFNNPYKALKKVIQFLDKEEEPYNDLYDQLTEYALSFNSFIDACLEWDILKLYIMLQKLVEAANLITARTYVDVI